MQLPWAARRPQSQLGSGPTRRALPDPPLGFNSRDIVVAHVGRPAPGLGRDVARSGADPPPAPGARRDMITMAYTVSFLRGRTALGAPAHSSGDANRPHRAREPARKIAEHVADLPADNIPSPRLSAPGWRVLRPRCESAAAPSAGSLAATNGKRGRRGGDHATSESVSSTSG